MIVGPDANFREQVTSALRASGWLAEEVQGGAEALLKLDTGEYNTMLLDRRLVDPEPTEVSEIARKLQPNLSVCVGDLAATLSSLTRSAVDGPTDTSMKLPKVGSPADLAWTPTDPSPASSKCEEVWGAEEPLPNMIGSSPAMRLVYRLARLVAPRLTTVLILGGTGTGKELVARGIHRLSRRSQQPFLTVNCAAIPESLFEAELFGYARGAFTGAFQTRIGTLHAAHGGTLFLDEIGDLPPSMQAKLLRFLQDGEVQRLGSAEVLHVDVRVIAATNFDLAEGVREKTFREDLYYRLSVFPIEIRPLQERVEDLMPLSIHFLAGLCRENGASMKHFSIAAEEALRSHSWPGNVRELQHVIERAFILVGGSDTILRKHINVSNGHKPLKLVSLLSESDLESTDRPIPIWQAAS